MNNMLFESTKMASSLSGPSYVTEEMEEKLVTTRQND